jgi:diguanylate cyclase (GGDEF)-like protein
MLTKESGMITIDPRTIIVFASILAGLMTLILISVRWSFREHVRGLLPWVAGMAAVCVASVLYALRGAAPNLITVVIANGIFLFSACCWTAGTLIFYGRPPRSLLLIVVCVAETLLMGWYELIDPNYAVRLVAFTATATVLYLTQAYVALRYGERHFVTWFFAGALVLEAMTMLARCLTGILVLPEKAHFLSTDTIQLTYLLFANAMPLVLATGFFMAATRKIHGRLEELSRRDPLTGILNRRAFFEQFDNERARLGRHSHALSVIVLDVDHFKQINDNCGHAVGDGVLADLCVTVKHLLRRSDAFGRIGGEEFAILLPETDCDSAFKLAERIRENIALRVSCQHRAVTVSLGVAGLLNNEETPQAAMLRADEAMYRAKKNGRNQSVRAQVEATATQPNRHAHHASADPTSGAPRYDHAK